MKILPFYCPNCKKYKHFYQVKINSWKLPYCKHCDTQCYDVKGIQKKLIEQEIIRIENMRKI